MKIASWIIRGLNCPIKQQEVKTLLLDHQIDILGILETRNLVFYNPSTISISHQVITSQMISCKAHHYGTKKDFCGILTLSGVLRRKKRHNPPVLLEMQDFNACLSSCFLDDLPSTGNDLTWTTKQNASTRVWSKLDRVLVNLHWSSSFPTSYGQFMEMGVSDHFPVLVFVSEEYKVVRRFSFLNSWITHPDYQSTVVNAWCTSKTGSPSFCFFQKLKNVKHALANLHKENFSQIQARVKDAKNALLNCQSRLRSDLFSTDLIQEERVRLAEFSRLKTAELAMLSQRDKIRKHQQIIGAIQDQHGLLQLGLDNVSAAFQDYNFELLGKAKEVTQLDSSFLSMGAKVSPMYHPSLTQTVTCHEIQKAVFSIDSESSPGIDGFSFGFFKSAWPLIGSDFCSAV
ncbi:uncharacterized protein LOC141632681 [Silene latifolia]|uniref:uncharacterized protein LOC141632681 n=1 Tax=Silene latifolia TaxID=37657 RepID=UPI003D77CABB